MVDEDAYKEGKEEEEAEICSKSTLAFQDFAL